MANQLLNPMGYDELRQAALVRAALQGNKIKSALAQNPGKVIVAPRRSGKTTALVHYIEAVHPNGAILFHLHTLPCLSILEARSNKTIGKMVTMGADPHNIDLTRGYDLPIYADEIGVMDSRVQDLIIADPRFRGAVTTPWFIALSDHKAIFCK
jgi:hypothetical protein